MGSTWNHHRSQGKPLPSSQFEKCYPYFYVSGTYFRFNLKAELNLFYLSRFKPRFYCQPRQVRVWPRVHKYRYRHMCSRPHVALAASFLHTVDAAGNTDYSRRQYGDHRDEGPVPSSRLSLIDWLNHFIPYLATRHRILYIKRDVVFVHSISFNNIACLFPRYLYR